MKNFIEVQNWGFNALIVSSVITVIFSLLQGYGLFKQAQKIWKERSAEAISAPFFFYLFFYMIAFMFYGISKNSLAMIVNSLLFLTCAPITIGIMRFKKMVWSDYLCLILCIAMVPTMIMIENKDLFLSMLLIISLLTIISQPMTIIRSKSRGSIEIKFIIIFLLTAIFWCCYSFIIKNGVLAMFNFAAAIFYILTLHLFYKLKPVES